MIRSDDLLPRCGCREAGCLHTPPFASLWAFDQVVNLFAAEMMAKFRQKFWDGRHGWDDPQEREYLLQSLRSHVEKGDMVDVANLAAMLWNMREWTL